MVVACQFSGHLFGLFAVFGWPAGGWLAGWLGGWLVGWLVGCLTGWLGCAGLGCGGAVGLARLGQLAGWYGFDP